MVMAACIAMPWGVGVGARHALTLCACNNNNIPLCPFQPTGSVSAALTVTGSQTT